MRRLPLLTSVAAIGLVALLVANEVSARQHARREWEWAHGGDAVTVEVRYRVTGKTDAAEAALALGWPVGSFDGPMAVVGEQALVVRVTSAGPARTGRYELIALDRRYDPPRVLNPNYGRDGTGHTGMEWGSHLNVLAERYDWLAGTVPIDASGEPSWEGHPMAVGAPADSAGPVMALFDLGQGAPPTTSPTRDLMLALIYVNDGVRWARQVPLNPAG